MMKHHHQEEEEQNQQQQQQQVPRVYIINFANATTTTRTTTTAVDSSGGNDNNDDDDDDVVDSYSSRSQNKSQGPAVVTAKKIRIPQMNTLGMLLRQYIMSELDKVEQQQHDNIDAIILTGGLYNHFSVGADLNEMNQFLSLKKNNNNNNNRDDDNDDDNDDDDGNNNNNNNSGGGNGNGVVHLGSSSRRNGTGSNNRNSSTTTTRRRSNYTLIDVVNRIESFPKPIIACISGNCFGGGLEIALSCHYRIACNAFCYTNPTTSNSSSSSSSSTTTIVPTRFGLPEVLVGLIPGAGGTQRLPKLVGIQNSIELIITGKHIDAKHAQNMGLIDDIVVPTTTTSLTTTDQSSSSSSYYYDMMLQRSQQWIMEMKNKQQQQLLQQSAGSSSAGSSSTKTIHHHRLLLRRTSLLPLREQQQPAIVHGIFHVAQLSLPDIHGDGYCANAALIAIRAGVITPPDPAVNDHDDDHDDENDIDDDKKNTTRAKQQQQRQRRDVVVEYGMNIEREQFIDCLLSNQGRAMRHVFFAIRTAQKPITTTTTPIISIPSTKQPSCSATLQKHQQQQQQNMDVNDHILIKHVRDYKNRITMMSMMENKTQNNNNNKNAGTTAPASSSPATATNVVHVGVIGAGTMGSGIAIVLLNAGYTVYLVDVSNDALKRGIQNIHTNIQSSMKKKEISTLIANDRISRIIGTTNIEDLKHCLLVVEAVIENMSLKCTIFQKLDNIIRNKQALLLTNTSTLDVDRMSNIAFDHHHDDHNEKKSNNNSHNPSSSSSRYSSCRRLGYFAGWHFFSPAHRMPLVEIVISKRYTSHRTITILQAITKAIGKTGVVVGNCDGFCGNRMLKPYSAETCALLVEQKQPTTTTPIITMRRSRRHDDDDDEKKNNNNNRNNNNNYYNNNEKMNNNNNNPIVRVDQALLKFGMKLGPFQMADLAGNDVGYNVRKARGWVRDDDDDSESDHSSRSSIIIPKNRPLRYTELPDIMVSKYHRYGQKVGKGWYDYHPNIGNGRIGIPSKQMMELINQYSISSSVVDNNNNNNSNILSTNYNDYVIERVLYPLVNEGFKCLEENIVRQPSDIDIVYIFGYGWPAYRGGPIYWANYEIGLDSLYVKLLEFSKQFPTEQHYIPSKLLQRCVQLDITVYEYYKRGLHQITNNNNNNKQKEEEEEEQSSYSKL